MRRENTKKTIEFLQSFFRSHSDKWVSTNGLSRLAWKAAVSGCWIPSSRIGRILSELEDEGLIEKSVNGLWWRSRTLGSKEN